jgi:aminopeptidase-like protein
MVEAPTNSGQKMAKLVEKLYPQNRSIIGPGIRDGFRQIAKTFETQPQFHKVKSGKKFANWTVPQGWELNSFHVKCINSGKTIVNSNETNLRVWSHSKAFTGKLEKAEFLEHIRVHSELREAIPYVTAYYSDNWGFSFTQEEVENLCDGPFEVNLDTTLQDDFLEIMDVLIPGRTSEEIFFSTYLCHPSMVVNELSGPTVAAELIAALEKSDNFYSYRFIFLPETIGSIIYSQKFLRKTKKKIVHAFNLNCLGGFEEWSFLASRDGDTYTDNLVRQYLGDSNPGYIEYPFSQRGSDERQYCNPNINLPIVSIMRKKYHEYPEYHTHLDDLSLNIPKFYEQSLNAFIDICNIIEVDQHIFAIQNSEPFLNSIFQDKRLGGQNHLEANIGRQLCNFLMYSDGRTFSQICKAIGVPLIHGIRLLEISIEHSLVRTERRKVKSLRELQL